MVAATAAALRLFEPVERPAEVAVFALEVGARLIVTRLDRSDPVRLHKLLALGVLPGAGLTLRRRSPCFLLQVGHTQLAVDASTARAVFGQRVA